VKRPGRGAGQEPDESQGIHQVGVATGDGRVVQAGRDAYVSQERPAYRLAALPGQPSQLPPEDARRQPSRLLDPRRRVVTFAGRDAELGELASWLDGPERVAVRLINGSGGQGKTRLAQHFARLSADRGWQVHVAYPADHAGSGEAVTATSQEGLAGKVLIVVDYAERWALDHLLGMISDIQGQERDGLRFLLLGRPAGRWWYGLSHRLEGGHGLATDTLQLPVLAVSPDERLTAFVRARDCFAEALGVPDAAAVSAPGTLDDDAYGVALTIHMAALAALDAHAHAEAAPDDPGRLSEYLLRRELVYWQDLHRRGGEVPVVDANTMGRAVFTAALTGPHPHAQGATVIKRVSLADDPVAVERILDAHALCYPPRDQAMVLEPLLPDRLAEDFLALATPGHPYAYPADAWTATSLRLLFSADEGDDAGTPSQPYARQALTMLIETAARWEHVARNHLGPLLREQPRLALSAGGAALITLAGIRHLDPAVLEAIEEHLPRQHIDLDMGIAALTERLTEHLLPAAADQAEQARLHLALGIRKGIAGLADQAAGSLEQAVALFRTLPASQAVAARTDLASALTQLGIAYLHLGRGDDAVPVLEEAASLREQATPDAEGLATTLDMLQVAMSHTGRRQEALELSRIVAEGWRRYAPKGNEASAQRGRALLNRGNRLAEERGTSGTAREAMAATKEAVAIFRRLAADDPGTYSPDLARSLLNLSGDLGQAGQRENARKAIAEAVALYREMSQVNPAAFQADYGNALFNFGTLLAKARHYQDAYAALSETLSVFQGEHIDDSVSNRLMLALTQATIAALLIDLDDPGAAAARAREAITLIREHGPAGSVTLRERIAGALGHVALQLGAGQMWGEALESADLSSQMFLKLMADDPSLTGYAEYAVGIPLTIRAAMADPQLQGRMRALSRERGRDKPPAVPPGRKKPKPKKKPKRKKKRRR
jgi:tetratricopeptide (TPR) repeat protein